MSIQLSKRAHQLKESPTLALAAKAKELKAQGLDILSLTVGEPDWATVDAAVKEAITAIHEGKTRYTPASGNPSLRKVIAEQFNQDFKTNYTEAHVSVATGAKYSLFSAFQSLLDQDDEVIIPKPYWVSYPEMVELCGASSKAVDLQGIATNEEQQKIFENAFSSKTKMLLMNSPNNPSGLTLSAEDLKYVADVLKKRPNVFIVCDDIYNQLMLDGSPRAPHILDVAFDLNDRVLSINGASKSYAMTGWRMGWAIGPQYVVKAMTNFQSQSTGCPNSIAQSAAEGALKYAAPDVAKAKAILKTRSDIFSQELNKIPNISFEPPTGAFYLWVDVSYYLKKKSWSSDQFCEALLESQKLVVVPGSSFGQDTHIRLSFAVDEKTILKSVERLHNFIQSL